MTLTAVELTADEVPFDRDPGPARRRLSWRAALWSVVSVRWAAVALTLSLAGLTAQLNGVVDVVSRVSPHRWPGFGSRGRCKSVAQQGP